MASACVNNIGMSPEGFSPVKCPSYGWLNPKISVSHEFSNPKAATTNPYAKNKAESDNVDEEKLEHSDPDAEISVKDFVDFEFQLEDPVTMLPADELFSDGKLMPLHISTMRHSITTPNTSSELRPESIPRYHRRNEISPTDPYLFSPKAPTCSIRWKELLRLKKLYQNGKEDNKTESSLSSQNNTNRSATRSLKYFLHRGSKSSLNSSIDSSLNLPLLKDPENESALISSRLSLSSSSSSSGHDHDDLPRLSLDSDKPNTIPRSTNHQITASNLSKVRVAKHRSLEKPRVDRSPMRRPSESTTVQPLGVSMDSPRMNSSGKIVFQSLERSSSSPSTFNGGPRHKHRGMERSYSANVRITPVLNVPVCSLRGSSKSGMFGLPMFSSSQPKKDGSSIAANRTHPSRNRTDRT